MTNNCPHCGVMTVDKTRWVRWHSRSAGVVTTYPCAGCGAHNGDVPDDVWRVEAYDGEDGEILDAKCNACGADLWRYDDGSTQCGGLGEGCCTVRALGLWVGAKVTLRGTGLSGEVLSHGHGNDGPVVVRLSDDSTRTWEGEAMSSVEEELDCDG